MHNATWKPLSAWRGSRARSLATHSFASLLCLICMGGGSAWAADHAATTPAAADAGGAPDIAAAPAAPAEEDKTAAQAGSGDAQPAAGAAEAAGDVGDAGSVAGEGAVQAVESVESVESGEGAAVPPPAGAEATPTEASAPAGKAAPSFIADGGRVQVRGGEFSIQPPAGWEVYNEDAGLTMLMQVPFKPGMKYQRTIQIASFAGPRYADEVTAREFEEIISRKFAAASASVEAYRIRNHLNIEMADGREALLFYSEFTMDGVNLMQAHILVSSTQKHYLLTFTDVAEHFETDAASRFLTEAWDAMISVQLGGRSPARFEAIAVLAIGAGILALLGIIAFAVRQWRASRAYREYADGHGLSDVDLGSDAPTTLTSSAQVSLPASKIESKFASKFGGKSMPQSTLPGSSLPSEAPPSSRQASASELDSVIEKRSRGKKSDRKVVEKVVGKKMAKKPPPTLNSGIPTSVASEAPITNSDDNDDLAV